MKSCRHEDGERIMPFTLDYAEQEPMRSEIDAITGPLLVEFGAPWCPHCQAVQPTLATLLERFPSVTHVKVYDGRRRPLGRSFRVKLWPNLVFLRDGQVLKQLARPSDDEILEGFKAIGAE
jgi:thioredoxin 1